MKRTASVLAALMIIAGAGLASSAADKLGPGQEGKLEIPGYKFPCVIYLPTDYAAGSRMPAVLHLHPYGGEPTTFPFRHATGGKGYIVVGLSYGSHPTGARGKDGFISNPRNFRAEVFAMTKFVEQVRTVVDQTWGLDQKRVFLSGNSMGGLAINCFGFHRKAKDRYRGFCLIAAGPMETRATDFSVARGLPVLLINGEKDFNLASATDNKPLLEEAGAIVTQVIVPGEGHGISEAKLCPPLLKWLQGIEDEGSRAWIAQRTGALKALAATNPAAAALQIADLLPRLKGLPEEKEMSDLLKSLKD